NIGVRHLMRGVTGIKGDFSRRQYKLRSPTCQQELELSKFNWQELAGLSSPGSRASLEQEIQIYWSLRGSFLFQHHVYPAPDALRVGGLGPQLLAVNYDCRRPINTLRRGFLDIGNDGLLDPIAVHIGLELIDAETQLARVGNKNGSRVVKLSPGSLVSIETIVHFPKLALQLSRLCRAP